jgi:hypothetical protein
VAAVALAVLVLGGGALALILVLSSSRVSVPDLAGMSWEQARRKLEKSGLSAEKSEVSSDRYDPDTVIAQSPAAGQKVEKGSVVRVDVTSNKDVGEGDNGTGAYAVSSKEIEELVNRLKAGRESADLALFMSCYSPSFISTPNNNPSYANKNYTEWQQAQAKYFDSRYRQEMTVENLQITVNGQSGLVQPKVCKSIICHGSPHGSCSSLPHLLRSLYKLLE